MTRESTIKAFALGDIFAGATLLNDPNDDHAGPGRIIQFDGDLKEKGVLWTEGTTHLVGGLKFGPDGNLWAFDSNAHCVLRIAPDGRQLPRIDFAERSFSNCNFAPDGTVLMGEHLVGSESRFPLGTTLSHVPGTEVFGYGHVHRFTLDGKEVAEYATETTGGMTGFLGVTTSSLAADGKTLVYSSETGPKVFQYDVEADKQLPDLVSFTPESRQMVLVATHRPDGTLLMIKAVSRTEFVMVKLDAEGKELSTYELPGPGWAIVSPSLDDEIVLLGNFFTGTVAKYDLNDGKVVAQTEVGVQRSLAGIAQYPG
jgi:outer membrane protein assembly factor BamB